MLKLPAKLYPLVQLYDGYERKIHFKTECIGAYGVVQFKGERLKQGDTEFHYIMYESLE